IGSIHSGLMPICDSDCYWLLSDNIQCIGSIRCYSDSTLSVKLASGSCHKDVPDHVTLLPESDMAFSISPNPADKYIKVDYKFNGKVSVEIVDLKGRIVIPTHLAEG